MTAPDITTEERAAFLEVRRQLADGELKHNPEPTNMAYMVMREGWLERPMIFNMSTGVSTADCGTVMCIGGHAARLMGMKTTYDIIDFIDDDRFEYLFYPPNGSPAHYRNIIPEEAIVAIDRFLAGDERPWRRDDE